MVFRRVVCFVLLFAVIGCSQERVSDAPAPAGQSSPRRIGVFLFTDHSAINASRDGFVAYVRAHPEVFGKAEITERNAGGDETKLATYASYFATEPFDVVCVLGTPAARTLLARNQQNRVVFAAPPNAAAVGLKEHAIPVLTSGVTYAPQTKLLVAKIREALPTVRAIGILHNPAETNSRPVVEQLERDLRAAGIDVVRVPVNNSAEVGTAAARAAGSVGAFVAPNDNTVHQAFSALQKVSDEHRLPIISVDRGAVAKGALLAVGGDYMAMGRMAGELAAKLLSSDAPVPIIDAAAASRVYVNPTVARQLGITLPPSVTTGAEVVTQ